MRVETLVLTEYQSNCYLVESEGEAIIIDPGAPSLELIERVSGLRVKCLLNTHAHPDHIGGDEYLKQKLGVPILLHRAEQELFRWIWGESLQPDQTLTEGDVIRLGRLSFEVLHTPGHTPGSITLLERAERMLFTGDLLFAGSIGRTDFPGGSDSELRKSLQRVVKLEGDWRIYPGHGPQTTLSHERWTNLFLAELVL